jgi:hypothetical protein
MNPILDRLNQPPAKRPGDRSSCHSPILHVLDQLHDLLEVIGFTRLQPQVPFRDIHRLVHRTMRKPRQLISNIKPL